MTETTAPLINEDVYDETQELAIERKVAEKAVKQLEALLRLQKNADFIKVFTELYFQAEPSRLVLLKADASQASPEQQESIYRQIDGIGQCHEFLQNIAIIGRQMQNLLKEGDELEAESNEEYTYE